MKRPYFIFSSGKLERKQNTLFFTPYNEEKERERLQMSGAPVPDPNPNPNGEDPVTGDEETEVLSEAGEFDDGFNSSSKRVMPIEDIDSLYLFGEINFNSRMLEFLNKKHIPAHIFNYYGYYSGSYYPNEYLVSGFLLVDQVTQYKWSNKRLRIARKIVYGAAANMLRNLKYYDSRGLDLQSFIGEIDEYLNQLPSIHDVQELMGVEGNIRQTYLNAFPKILGDKYDFNRRVKQPPDNAINALISFANTLVYTTCLTEIFKTQLSPLISFLHEPGHRRFSLALDLAEIFKPLLADRIIFTVLNQNRIGPKDFDKQLNYCYLKESGRKTFVKTYDEKLKTTIKHRKLNRHVSYRRLIRLECYKLVKHLNGGEAYEPFKAWW